MDPLSIATAATALATFTFRASKSIYDCIDDIQSANSTLVQLQNEVNALQSGLQSIASTFNSGPVVQLCKDNSANSFNQLQTTRLLNSVKPLLTDCQRTLEKLEAVIEGMESNPGKMRELLQKPIMAFKINLKSKDMDMIRTEIRSYVSAMQMTLHMVGICLTIDGNKQAETTGAGIEQKLTILAAQITDVQTKVSETNDIQKLEGETVVADDLESKAHVAHIQKHIEAAQEVFSNGSVYAGSVYGTVIEDGTDVNRMAGTFGSVMGLDDQRRRQIDNWLPREQLSEEDENSDVETDMFEARLSLARKKLKAKDYKAAEAQFQKCLDQTAVFSKLPPHEVTDLRLELSSACHGSGNFAAEQSVLLELLGDGDLPKPQMFQIQHRLAVAYLHEGQFAKARKYASETMKARRKLRGSQDQSYLETVKLLVDICKAQNNLDDAEMYECLLPDDFLKDEQTGHQATSSEEKANSSTEPPNVAREPANSFKGPAKSAEAPDNEAQKDGFENPAAIKLLSDKGFDIGNKNTYFEALKWAYLEHYKDASLMRFVLSKGSDLHGKDSQGRTMLMHASGYGFDDLIQQFIQRGADIDARDKLGYVALHHAVSNGHKEAARILLDAGTSIEVTDNNDTRPLHHAARGGHDVAVSFLLDRGANPDAPGLYGARPLSGAVAHERLSTVRLLLDRGANVNAGNDSGWTPLMVAAWASRPSAAISSIVELLLSRGADKNLKDQKGNTALKCAKSRANVPVIKLLKATRSGLFGRR